MPTSETLSNLVAPPPVDLSLKPSNTSAYVSFGHSAVTTASNSASSSSLISVLHALDRVNQWIESHKSKAESKSDEEVSSTKPSSAEPQMFETKHPFDSKNTLGMIRVSVPLALKPSTLTCFTFLLFCRACD
jgi:hypothetical protein